MTFGFAYWVIWYHRNQLIFKEEQNKGDIVVEIQRRVHEFCRGMEIHYKAGFQSIRKRHETKWKKPPEGWVKVNIDGACMDGGTRIAYGGAIREHNGSWIRGVAGLERSGSVLLAELKDIYHRLKLARSL